MRIRSPKRAPHRTRSEQRGRLAATAAAALALVLAVPPGAAHADAPSSITAGNPQHFINFNFGLPGDLTEYVYSIKVETPAATDDIYYAHYLFGKDSGTGYYSGLQPHPNGLAGVRFSFFGKGATPLNANCRSGADGGNGVTCGIDDLAYQVGRKYTIATKKTVDTAGVSYTGTIKDDTTGTVRTIGAWRVPADYAGFRDTANAFIEKFSGIKTCADIPAVKVSYTGVRADGKPVAFKPISHQATDKPGSGIYTCGDVSDYTVSAASTPGGYSVVSSGATG
ncbi:hypothetical protein AB0O91_15110 [Kitasatospora sp. NPDC089797]|uniref:DUF3472 domain-containing protein n=1 Tax=Kitasatospora sp. NPDC089797 TaxID=3155298 RepID=UPI0034201B5E